MNRTVFEAEYYPSYGSSVPLSLLRNEKGAPEEGGNVRFAWDESGLYVSAELTDSQIVVQNRHDEQFHYATGDVLELFVKPLSESYYWEMYAVPSGNKSTLFFPPHHAEMTSEQHLYDHSFRALEVTAEERADGWNARMFVPASQLSAFGARWDPSVEWTVFCGRYNYNSEDLSHPELSMAPPLSALNFHLTDEYALLKMNQ